MTALVNRLAPLLESGGSAGCELAENAAANEAVSLVEEGIYEFTSSDTLTYVGQSGDIPARLYEHLISGKLLPGDFYSVQTTEVLGGRIPREIAEQLRIEQLGGVGNLRNVRNAIGVARQYLLGR